MDSVQEAGWLTKYTGANISGTSASVTNQTQKISNPVGATLRSIGERTTSEFSSINAFCEAKMGVRKDTK